jgi:hypothetical protein
VTRGDKWILGIVIGIPFLLLMAVSYLYGVSLRNAAMIEGRIALKTALQDYAKFGYVTSYGSQDKVWLSTNVTKIDGTQYICFAEAYVPKFLGEGTLAVTTNQVFIWMDKSRSPKIITNNYRAPYFPPRF